MCTANLLTVCGRCHVQKGWGVLSTQGLATHLWVPPPHPLWTDTHLWEHYLPAIPFAGRNEGSFIPFFANHNQRHIFNSNTVNSNFHLIRSKTLPTNDFELTVPDLYTVTSTEESDHCLDGKTAMGPFTSMTRMTLGTLHCQGNPHVILVFCWNSLQISSTTFEIGFTTWNFLFAIQDKRKYAFMQ